jgi:hypothetical protein
MIICVVTLYEMPYGDMTFANGGVLINQLYARGRTSIDAVIFH